MRRLLFPFCFAVLVAGVYLSGPQPPAPQPVTLAAGAAPFPAVWSLQAAPQAASAATLTAAGVHARDVDAWYARAAADEMAAEAHPAQLPSRPSRNAPPSGRPVFAAGSSGRSRSGDGDGCGGWRQAISDAGFPDTGKACSVLMCESGGDPGAHNPSGASGLFQIMMPMHANMFTSAEKVWDPYANIAAAFSLSHGGRSWGGWVCR